MQRELLARHAPSDLVAFGDQGARTAQDLLRDAATVSAALPDAPKGSEVTLVIRTDRYALAVAILAAWARDYVPSLPPELDRDAITALASAADTVTVLHDTASGIPLRIGALLAEPAAHGALAVTTWQARTLNSHSYERRPDRTLAPAAWGKDWLGQARALAELLSLAPRQRCATSVGTEHAHGIVLGVLVPLLTGGAFLREPLAPRALATQLGPLEIDLLVSVPAHLPALLAAVPNLALKLARVVSALGSLPAPLLAETRAVLQCEVSDLAHAAAPIPILHCANGPSPDLTEQTLDLRLERWLSAQPGVRDAVVLAVSSADGPRLYGALVGDALDLRVLRAALETSELGAHQIELLVLHRIRRDGIGRAQRDELLRQFRLRPDGSTVNLELAWGESSVREGAQGAEHHTRVHVPADYGYFDGHFTGYPILAGAAQLGELVLPCVRRVRPELNRLTSMSRLKFTGRIQPGETIDVVLSMRPGAATVDFALKRAEALCSAGTLSFSQFAEEEDERSAASAKNGG
jgi:hypothetical protein